MQSQTSETTHYSYKQSWLHLLILLILAGVFGATLLSAFGLGLGNFSGPGPGLWPALASGLGLIVVGILGTLIIVQKTAIVPSSYVFSDISWIRFTVFVGSALGFLYLYPLVGFVPAAAVTSLVILKYASRASWLASIVTALVASVALYYIFAGLLNVRI